MKTLTRTSMEQLPGPGGLRAPAGQRPLAQAIAELCTEVASRAGCKVDYQAPAKPRRCRPAVAEALWADRQEALANLRSIPGQKRPLTLDPGRTAAVRVSDDGVSPPEEAEARPGTTACAGLRERVEGSAGFTAGAREPARTTIETASLDHA